MSSYLKEIDLSDYKFVRNIGNGEYGCTDEVINNQTGEKMAIKTMFYESLDSLKCLINSLEVYFLNIPGTLKIFGYQIIYFKDEEGILKLAMELLKYNVFDLNYHYICKDETDQNIINPTIRCEIIFGVASILKKMHYSNVIFRDVKLQKVGLGENLVPTFFHNSLTKIVKDPSYMTQNIGTTFVMAPKMFMEGADTVFLLMSIHMV